MKIAHPTVAPRGISVIGIFFLVSNFGRFGFVSGSNGGPEVNALHASPEDTGQGAVRSDLFVAPPKPEVKDGEEEVETRPDHGIGPKVSSATTTSSDLAKVMKILDPGQEITTAQTGDPGDGKVTLSNSNEIVIKDLRESLLSLVARSSKWMTMDIEERIEVLEYLEDDLRDKERLISQLERLVETDFPELQAPLKLSQDLLTTFFEHAPIVRKFMRDAKESQEEAMAAPFPRGRSLTKIQPVGMSPPSGFHQDTGGGGDEGNSFRFRPGGGGGGFKNWRQMYQSAGRRNPYKYRQEPTGNHLHDIHEAMIGNGHGRRLSLHKNLGSFLHPAPGSSGRRGRRMNAAFPTTAPAPTTSPSPTPAPVEPFIENCNILKDCVDKMSRYDVFVLFHSDDIDNDAGTIDRDDDDPEETFRTFDEGDILEKFATVKRLSSSLDTSNLADCSALLQQFHRLVEFGGVNNWEGASVSQVCLAEGTNVFVQLNEIQKVSKEAAGEVFQETYRCSRRLYNARPTEFMNEKFVFQGEDGLITLPTGYLAYDPANPDANEGVIDEHGQLQPNEYPFETKRYDLGGVQFFNNYKFSGQCETAEACRGKNAQCKAEVRRYYNDIFQDSVPGEDVCYPTVYIKGRHDGRKWGCGSCGLLGCDRYCYSLELFTGFPACYTATSHTIYTPPRCIGWYEDDQITLGNPDCTQSRKGCEYAKVEGTSNVFAGGDFEELDTAIELVFGEKASVGFICSIAESVAGDNKTLPGRCCLSAPFQTDDPWGQPYSCNDDCHNHGPYFSGIDTEACNAYGGTWCPLPQNCTELQNCVQDFIDAENKVTDMAQKNYAFLSYLTAAPEIQDASVVKQCQRAREYFGFDRDFLDGGKICGDIEQFRLTEDFDFLNEFFNQGSSPTAGCDGRLDCWLTKPKAEDEFASEVQQGKGWRVENFVLAQITAGANDVFNLIDAFCPDDVPSKTFGPCGAVEAAAYLVYVVFRLVSDISTNAYSEGAEVGNVEPLAVYENTKVLFDNMVKTLEVIVKLEESLVGPTQSDNVSFKGCDGKDNDKDGFADECDEDDSPPELVVPEVWRTQSGVDCDVAGDGGRICLDEYFKTIAEAEAFLNKTLRVTDDCAQQKDLRFDIYVNPEPSCDKTQFTVTPVHTCDIYETCGKPVTFELGVDGDAPELTCGFVSDSSEQSPDGTNMLFIDSNDDTFLDTAFFYDIQENCPENVKVEVNVETNELTRNVDELVFLRTVKQSNRPDQPILYVTNQFCPATPKRNDPLCRKDPNPSVSSRFYEIKVVATDASGNTDHKTCVVIIKPNENSDHGMLWQEYLSSMTRFQLDTLNLNWDNELAPSEMPSGMPSSVPSNVPTPYPSSWPSVEPSVSMAPSSSIDCDAYKNDNEDVNFDRMCRDGSCCTNPRSSSHFCWEQYLIFGVDVSAACRECCKGAGHEAQEIGPPNKAIAAIPQTISCDSDQSGLNIYRMCKDLSCCSETGSGSMFCKSQYNLLSDEDVKSICWYCCFPSVEIIGFDP